MQERVTKLEILCDVYKRELEEFKRANSEELSELRGIVKEMSENLSKLNIVLIKIKWLITGAVILYAAQEVGILNALKALLGVK